MSNSTSYPLHPERNFVTAPMTMKSVLDNAAIIRLIRREIIQREHG